MASQNFYNDDDSIEFLDDNDDEDLTDFIPQDDLNNLNRKRKSITKSTNKKLIKLDNQSENKRASLIPKPETSNTKQILKFKIDSLCEYAHVLMHCILYKINYYNKKTHFDKVLKYNIIVYKCKSEIVCEYITNCIESMRIVLYKIYNLDEQANELEVQGEKNFSIGLAVLKSFLDDQPTNNVNLLIKRYTLQIENLEKNLNNSSDEELETNSASLSSVDEWNFRDSILKCLYSKDIVYSGCFKWQIQIRTSFTAMNELGNKEDLFKLFAWRQCDQEETTSITTKHKTSSSLNRISIKPVKSMKDQNFRVQLFIEQPTAPSKTQLGLFSQDVKEKYRRRTKSSQNLNNNSNSPTP